MEYQESVCSLVRELEAFDQNGETVQSTYVTQNMRRDIDQTEAYLNSKFTSGNTDSLGREKPFDNIVIFNRNIWYRATKQNYLDFKIIPSGNNQAIPALLATVKLREWMEKQDFGAFLNNWGLTLASHGSAILQFVEKDGEMSCKVEDWNQMIVDPIDFDNNVKIKKLYLTPAQLRKNKNYDQDKVAELLENLTTRKTIKGQTQDFRANYICLYEVHGELPLSYLTDNEADDDTFVQQMHVITYQATNKKGRRGEKYDDYTLYRGKEKQDPYMITHLIKKDGVTYTGGAVKNLFEAQWMVNTSAKQMYDQLDLASKLLWQTSDTAFAGSNVLTSIENGDILNHKINEPLTQLSNRADIAAMQSFAQQWKISGNQQNGISDALAGVAPKSGTAWRSQQSQLQEAHSLFDLMRETKDYCVKDMFHRFLLPSFKKQLKNSKEISGILKDHEIKQIDQKYVPNEITRRVNQIKKDTILSGKIYDTSQEAQHNSQMANQIQSELQGNQRFISPDQENWEKEFDVLDWDNLSLHTSSEDNNNQEALATLSTVLQTIVSNPRALSDPNARLIFNKILRSSGIVSEIEIQDAQPFVIPPTKRFTETLDYKDAPEDIKRQMEEQQGFTPSQQGQQQGQPIQQPMQTPAMSGK